MDLHRLAEARSLAIHSEIATRLLCDRSILDRARDTLRRWSSDGRIGLEYARQCETWLSRSPKDIAALLTDKSEEACALRQNSPFVGIVDPRRRWASGHSAARPSAARFHCRAHRQGFPGQLTGASRAARRDPAQRLEQTGETYRTARRRSVNQFRMSRTSGVTDRSSPERIIRNRRPSGAAS